MSLALLALLFSFGQSAEPLDAEALLRAFGERLSAEPAGEDTGLVALELARVRAAQRPRLSVRQSSDWTFGGEATIGIGAAVTVPVLDPEAAAQELLVRQRLALAQHNDLAERQRRVYEFRRSLRLLAHVEEVVTALERHRRDLLALRPRSRDLEGTEPGVPLDGQDLGYLEVIQALERARSEHALLLELVSANVGIGVDRLAESVLGRPPMPGTELNASLEECKVAFDEARRAQLVRRTTSYSAALEASRTRANASLDLSGDLSYRPAAGSSPSWRGDLRLALRVALPSGGPMSGKVTLAVTPSGLGQELTVSWPVEHRARSAAGEDAEYQRALDEARLAVLRAVAARDDAETRVALRRLTLRSELSSAGGASASRLNAVAQARLALLNAELDFDLAVLDLAETCGRDAQARMSTTSRLSAARRSTSSSRSAWSSSILPSSLRTNRV